MVLDDRAQGVVGHLGAEAVGTEGPDRVGPVDGLRHPGGLGQVQAPQGRHRPGHLGGEVGGHLGSADAHDVDLALERGEVDPVVEAPPLEGVVELAGAVRRDDHHGRVLGPDGADLGHGHLEVGEHLEEERLELVVGPVDLVDQQHGAGARPQRPQQRSLHQEARVEDLLDSAVVSGRPLRQRPQVQQLAGVVPLVEGLAGVDALVALEADELDAEGRRHRLGHLGLAHSGLTLEQ